MARRSIFEIPKPKTFLYLMSLRTGTELITLTVLINKISGFYGILALFTGFHLSWLQLSMYIYSILAVVLTAYLAPHIRKASPLQCLALAWFYTIDSIINAIFTAVFGVAWFVILAQHAGERDPTPGGKTIDDTAGFTSPKYNVSKVDVVATPADATVPAQDAVAIGSGGPAGIGNAVFQSGSMMSITVISALWCLRVYFIFVMMAYARLVLRQHITQTAASNYQLHTGSTSESVAENPFAEDKEEGKGWQGNLGRAMVNVGKKYWLGNDEDGEWMRNVGGRFRKSTEPVGVLERERRRRSGTGPPAPHKMPQFVEQR
ncbi:DUF1753-domain-containing protein [Patellaria atrata CBS 101060]|uniref:DUF1753-domain-containing protein n=1 Tax=Patellaria atrata CBS 101060 TaxID=1346257 RepID=A0A9P4VPJ4_9PEZI|nr:DUF1753-domain-containing protein [Patellaria atrata CBS 101060]